MIPPHPLLQEVQSRFNFHVREAVMQQDHPLLVIEPKGLVPVASFLRDEKGFDILMDLSCVDYLKWEEKADRFEVIYNLYRLKSHERLLIKVPVNAAEPVVDSVFALWASANWFEREVWDMFGIRFEGHPDLKRILLYEEFKGHPLRKDYPYFKRQPLVGPKN